MKTNKPQIIESAEYTTDNAKTVLAVMFTIIMLAVFGVLVQIASHISVITY
jgi:hypothetical protein